MKCQNEKPANPASPVPPMTPPSDHPIPNTRGIPLKTK